MLAVINPSNSATEMGEWGSSGFANSAGDLYPD